VEKYKTKRANFV